MPPPIPRFDALLSIRGVLGAAFLYGAINAALTMAAGPALALDDVKLNVLTQSLEAGYLPDNPPLFEWTLILAQQTLGPTLASFVAVKTLFLTLTAAFTFLAAKEAGAESRTAAAAALALPLIPQFGWSFHQTLTHSTALFAATALFWWALLRLRRCSGLADYALLGLALGLGLLSKYSFPAAAAAAFVASFLHDDSRRALTSPRMFIAIAVCAAATAPHLLWAASAGPQAAALSGERLAGTDDHLRRAVDGTASVIWAAVSFLAPMAIAVFLVNGRKNSAAFWRRRSILADATTLSIAGLTASAFFLGVSDFHERYAIAFFYPGFMALAMSVTNAAPLRALAAASIAAAALFTGVRTAETVRPGAPFCEDCRQYIPYAYLHEALTKESLRGATLVGFDDHTAGNLRRLFPQARVISSHQPFYSPPPAPGGTCRFIWSADLSPPPPQAVLDRLNTDEAMSAGGLWKTRMNGEAEYRSTHWSIAVVDPATPFGAALCRL
jgi:4-amino-4-deoxy-L-arabinose transferase-like glycosyltransferase